MGVSNCYGGSISYMAANTLTHCGYLYNWYGATGGTGIYSMSTSGEQASGSICPINFRLPSSISSSSGPTTNGTVHTHADFPVLRSSMNAGTLTAGSNSSGTLYYQTNWQPSSTWSGTFSGSWSVRPDGQGLYGYFWSSSSNMSSFAHALTISTDHVSTYNGVNSAATYEGLGVRCLLE